MYPGSILAFGDGLDSLCCYIAGTLRSGLEILSISVICGLWKACWIETGEQRSPRIHSGSCGIGWELSFHCRLVYLTLDGGVHCSFKFYNVMTPIEDDRFPPGQYMK